MGDQRVVIGRSRVDEINMCIHNTSNESEFNRPRE